MKVGTLRLTKFRLPCVYEFINAPGRCLYVGYSAIGIGRVFQKDRGFHCLRHYAFCETSVVRIIAFDNIQEAQQEEKRLIREYQPPFNTAGTRRDKDGYRTISLLKQLQQLESDGFITSANYTRDFTPIK